MLFSDPDVGRASRVHLLFTFAVKVVAKKHYSGTHFRSNRFVYDDDQQSLYMYEVYILVYGKVDDGCVVLLLNILVLVRIESESVACPPDTAAMDNGIGHEIRFSFRDAKRQHALEFGCMPHVACVEMIRDETDTVHIHE